LLDRHPRRHADGEHTVAVRLVVLAPLLGGQWTERVLRVDSLEDGAKLAKAWIELRLRA
jgi:hypothetical protein